MYTAAGIPVADIEHLPPRGREQPRGERVAGQVGRREHSVEVAADVDAAGIEDEPERAAAPQGVHQGQRVHAAPAPASRAPSETQAQVGPGFAERTLDDIGPARGAL